MESITLVTDAIHRPDEPRHFMEFTFPAERYVARVGDVVIADSNRVLKLAEVGFHIYDPVLYFLISDTDMAHLASTDKSTHCPLKGDTQYFDFVAGDDRHADIGWRYAKPLDFAAILHDYIAFDRTGYTYRKPDHAGLKPLARFAVGMVDTRAEFYRMRAPKKPTPHASDWNL